MSSRRKDLEHVEDQIRKLSKSLQEIQEGFQRYHGQVRDTVRGILEKAGVWKEVNSLELERAEAGAKAEEKAKALQAQAVDLQRVRSFLLGREQEEPSETVDVEKDSNPPEEVEVEVEENSPKRPVPPEF